MFSTKGRYALRVLIDLAEMGADSPVPLKDIAQRQGISEKYLQHIAKLLVDQGLIAGTSGKGGGYLLARKPEECFVSDVIEATEGTLAPVACLACDADECNRSDTCKTLPMWKQYHEITRDYFSGITIADLANGLDTVKRVI